MTTCPAFGTGHSISVHCSTSGSPWAGMRNARGFIANRFRPRGGCRPQPGRATRDFGRAKLAHHGDRQSRNGALATNAVIEQAAFAKVLIVHGLLQAAHEAAADVLPLEHALPV